MVFLPLFLSLFQGTPGPGAEQQVGGSVEVCSAPESSAPPWVTRRLRAAVLIECGMHQEKVTCLIFKSCFVVFFFFF